MAQGDIPRAFHFLSQNFETPVNAGSLVSCVDCGLQYRFPCLSQQTLLSLYQKTPASLWDPNNEDEVEGREDFRRIWEEIATSRQHQIVCDIGCYTGSLLSYLRKRAEEGGATIETYGVEPSLSGATVAQTRGVRVVGKTVDDLVSVGLKCDVIVAVDVFEHVLDTRMFVASCMQCLSVGGKLIFVTGAADCSFNQTWRAQSYYMAMPEHVVFMTRNHAVSLEKCGLRLVKYDLIRRVSFDLGARVKLGCRNIVFLLVTIFGHLKAFKSFASRPRLRAIAGRGVGNCLNSPDHVIVVFTV